MSPDQIARTLRLRLAEEIADDLAALDKLKDAIESLRTTAPDERGEWMRTLALAFQLERYYTAFESMVVRILRTLDGDVPSGHQWHLELLRAACVAVPGLRPRVVAPEAEADLRELLKFRHLARHGYEQEPELGKLEAHAERAVRAHVPLRDGFEALRSEIRRADD